MITIKIEECVSKLFTHLLLHISLQLRGQSLGLLRLAEGQDDVEQIFPHAHLHLELLQQLLRVARGVPQLLVQGHHAGQLEGHSCNCSIC